MELAVHAEAHGCSNNEFRKGYEQSLALCELQVLGRLARKDAYNDKDGDDGYPGNDDRVSDKELIVSDIEVHLYLHNGFADLSTDILIRAEALGKLLRKRCKEL